MDRVMTTHPARDDAPGVVDSELTHVHIEHRRGSFVGSMELPLPSENKNEPVTITPSAG
jgi:hypothetical protein